MGIITCYLDPSPCPAKSFLSGKPVDAALPRAKITVFHPLQGFIDPFPECPAPVKGNVGRLHNKDPTLGKTNPPEGCRGLSGGWNESVTGRAEYPQQHQKKIDKVEVQRKRAQDCPFPDDGPVQSCRLGKGHILEFLGIIGG